MSHSREDLIELFCSALRETASDYEGIEFSEPSGGDLPTLMLFLDVGPEVCAASLNELDVVRMSFPWGEEIGLQVVPTPDPPADGYPDIFGERERVDAVRRAVRERIAGDWDKILTDDDLKKDARELARAIARDLDLQDLPELSHELNDDMAQDAEDLAQAIARNFGLQERPQDLWQDQGVQEVEAWLRREVEDDLMVGELVVDDDRLVACDPGLVSSVSEYGARRPFSRRVPTGRHTVRAVMEDGLPLAVCIWFSDKPVETLELALREGETPRDYTSKDRTGYVVGCGLGCIMDTLADAALEERDRIETDADWLIGPLHRAGLDDRGIVTLSLDDASPSNAVIFNTGGDGSVHVYWGLDDQGDLACLITLL